MIVLDDANKTLPYAPLPLPPPLPQHTSPDKWSPPSYTYIHIHVNIYVNAYVYMYAYTGNCVQ